MANKIYLLELEQPESYSQDLEIVRGFVVVAGSEGDARVLASQNAGDEGREAWLTSAQSVATEISRQRSASRKAGVILRDQRKR